MLERSAVVFQISFKMKNQRSAFGEEKIDKIFQNVESLEKK